MAHFKKKKEKEKHCIVSRPSPMDRTHIQKNQQHFQIKTAKVYSTLV